MVLGTGMLKIGDSGSNLGFLLSEEAFSKPETGNASLREGLSTVDLLIVSEPM